MNLTNVADARHQNGVLPGLAGMMLCITAQVVMERGCASQFQAYSGMIGAMLILLLSILVVNALVFHSRILISPPWPTWIPRAAIALCGVRVIDQIRITAGADPIYIKEYVK